MKNFEAIQIVHRCQGTVSKRYYRVVQFAGTNNLSLQVFNSNDRTWKFIESSPNLNHAKELINKEERFYRQAHILMASIC